MTRDPTATVEACHCWVARKLDPTYTLGLTVLAVNMLGDGLRDRLDPRLAKRI